MPRRHGQPTLSCDCCQAEGPIQYRVSSDRIKDWMFVCPTCWPRFQTETGYRYGGTRKANRRQRKR